MMKQKKQQQEVLLNKIILYSLTVLLTCVLFCSSPFWYPPLCAVLKVFLFVCLPRIDLLLFTPKCLFIVGNLIVIFLVGESKISAPEYPSQDLVINPVNFIPLVDAMGGTPSPSPSPTAKNAVFCDGHIRWEEYHHHHHHHHPLQKIPSPSPSDHGDQTMTKKLLVTYGCEGRQKKEGRVKKLNHGKAELEDRREVKRVMNLSDREDLNKRAEDFIARINEQRRIEAMRLSI